MTDRHAESTDRARRPRVRTLIAVTIAIEDRWSVAGPADLWNGVDVPAQVDPRRAAGATATGDGTAHLPGTSLAGSLKLHLGPTARRWLGGDPPRYEEHRERPANRDPDGGDYEPSALSLLGIEWADRPSVLRRGTTAINRETNAARDRTLRVEQHATPATLVLLLEHDGEQDADLLSAFGRWQPTIGRARSSGLGTARVRRVRAVTCDLTRPVELTWWLTDRHAWPEAPVPAALRASSYDTDDDGAPDVVPLPEPPPVLEVAWEVKEPVHVGYTRPTGSREPARTIRRGPAGSPPMIPGSAWRGVFRSRIELILSLCGVSIDDSGAILDGLFGGSGGRGVLHFHDAIAGSSDVRTQTHVAIDRFTGGAVDGGLFTVEVIPRGARLDQRVTWHGAHPPPAQVRTLLMHVARDLHDGLIGVGGSVGRGYGWLTSSGVDTHPKAVDVAALLTCTEPQA